MQIPTFIKYLVIAWGVPIAMIVIALTSIPSSNLSRDDLSQQSFTPAQVSVVEKKGTKGANHFELQIVNPKGEEFFIRRPNREPIVEINNRLPVDTPITVLYSFSELEGNVLMEIVSEESAILSFDEVMAEYASRRQFLYLVAAIWWGVMNLIALWWFRVLKKRSREIQA